MLPKRTKSFLAAKLGRFVQQYGRKATKGWDPNDRGYDRKLEEKMKRLPPKIFLTCYLVKMLSLLSLTRSPRRKTEILVLCAQAMMQHSAEAV